MRVLLAFWLLAVCVDHTEACSCPTQRIEEAFDAANHVFVAHITDIHAVPVPDGLSREVKFEDSLLRCARFTVVGQFKGNPSSVKELRAGFGHGDCGVPLIAGMDYLVLIDDSGVISYCNGFFGPHYGWGDKSLFETERRKALKQFSESIREHYKSKVKIARPPEADLGIEDATLRWFRPIGEPEKDSNCLGDKR